MDHQMCVLLYSKYSQHSKKFMSKIQDAPFDVVVKMSLHQICVDNEDIRRQVMLSNNIDINFVPCILIVYPDGGVEKYEGSNAFNWLDEIIRKHSPPPPPPVKRVNKQVNYQDTTTKTSSPETVSPKRKSQRKNVPEPTPIDEIMSEEDEDSEYEIPRPKAGLRMGSGNFEFGEDFGDAQEQTRVVSRGIKEPTEQPGSRKGGLMAAALAMQKSREGDEKALPRPPGMPTAHQ